MRNLTKTLAVVSLLAPASGHTLGIGEIKLNSALNQNLNAEIALTLSGESVSDIKVNLAPPEKFDEAGVSWTYFLSKIKFETITQSNGSAIIKLTSKEALKEPFLDFLLEVSWPKGNLYREFTVLVDPPSVYNQTAVPVSTRTESYVQPTVATPQQQAHVNGPSSGDEYGPTLGNDTLWSVAERARGQRDVSVEQMMIALYEANPHAFYKSNVHALMAGKMLKIPEAEAVLKLSRNQALAEFNRHTHAWKSHSAISAQAETAKEKPVVNQLTLIAPTKAAITDHAVVAPISEQASAKKKAVNASITPGIVAGKAGEVESEAAPTDGAIQSKIAALEKQLAMMQELIALKDQQLAALQKQSQAGSVIQGQATPEQVVPAKPVVQVTPAPQPVESMPAETVASKSATQVAPAAQPAEPMPGEAVPIKPAAQVAPTPQPVESTPSEAEKVKVVVPASPIPQQAVAAKPVQPLIQPEASLFDSYYLGVGAAGSMILMLMGWLWWRKRKIEEETNTESMFASSIMVKVPEANESLSAPLADESVIHNVGTIGESSFLSEFTPSDFDSFDTDHGEIDPISEADVYLAYGRYQQAEELIRQAIKDQPNRDECKLKLLEIFYANENQAAFEAYANELAAAGKRNELEFWEKAAEMGAEICPDSPLFSFGAEPFVASDAVSVENSDENTKRDGEFNNENVTAGTASFADPDSEGFVTAITESESSELDFDLSSFSMDAKELDDTEEGVMASSAGADKPQIEEIEFDLSSFSMAAKEADEAETDVIASSADTDKSRIEEIEFDLSPFSMAAKDEAETGVIASGAGAGKPQIEEIEFDLSSFSMDAKESGLTEEDPMTPNGLTDKFSGFQAEEIDFDLSSFSLDTKELDDADKDFIIPSILSDISLEPQLSDKKQEFEAYEFDLSFNNTDANEIESIDFNALEDAEGFDFNFDLDLPLTSGSSNQYDEFGVSDLTDMDELETKLDLAKAYIDMGDADAAKDIAKEVLEQGTIEQKKTAQALLDELN
ncbi:MAG: FimV/HubP family polar landmark protein [Methylobacter sp.]